jgi:mono/diheme cytochrome c family protein
MLNIFYSFVLKNEKLKFNLYLADDHNIEMVIVMKIFGLVVITIAAEIVLGLIFIFTGWYNVSAMNQDKGFTKWVLSTTSDRSVDFHSSSIKVPNLNDTSLIRIGFAHYKEMCESCHGGPGKKETELAKGLNPPAPDLAKSAKHMPPEEIFWVTKNGIKMTGMPAWGKTHSDQKIWAITAAVMKLPSITPAQYDFFKTENDAD